MSSNVEDQMNELLDYFDKHNYAWNGMSATKKYGRDKNGELYPPPDEWTAEMEKAQRDLRRLQREDVGISDAIKDFHDTDWHS